MTPENIQLAAKTLLARRCVDAPSGRLDEALRAQTIDDALAIQNEITRLRPDTIAAWKCLLPPADDAVVMAPIFANSFQQGATCALMPDAGCVRVEPEIAFVLAGDLPAQSQARSEAEIDAALASAHMALELMHVRLDKDSGASFHEKLSDCLVNQGVYLGPEINLEKAKASSAMLISIQQGDSKQEFAGKHPNPTAIAPLYWFINYASARGISFTKGQAFITGSFCGIVDLDFDSSCVISYEGLSSYELVFNALQEN